MNFRARFLIQAACVPVASVLFPAVAQAQRVFGLDTSSAANTNPPSQAQWDQAYNSGWAAAGIPSFQFAYIRSSRGGLTVNEARVDDAHFYDSITRATNSGMLAGSYHFARADLNPLGSLAGTNTGAGDATHYLERAGMYMKPGYLIPVFDMEDGNSENNTAQLTAWSMEWMNTIYNAKGFWPIVYTNSSYNNDEVGAELAWTSFGTNPRTGPRTYQWLARPAGSLTTGQPGAATNYPNPYGAWDPNFITRTNSRDPAINPWAFWQNGSAQIDPSGPVNNRFLVDFNAANGNMEFVKDFLVPALWTNAGSGDWGTISNWNSDNPDYNGTIQSGPAPRLPNNGSLDWVKLQNAGGGTVTISSGAQTVRKFYTQQPLNIAGGSLSVSYLPGSGGQFDEPSEFNAAVTMSPGAAYSSDTTLINGGGGTFNVNGGTVTFADMKLASHASNSGKIVMNGSATFAQTGGVGTSVIRSIGSLAQPGSITLSAGNQTFDVNNGTATVDLNVRVGVTGTGRLVKSGPGNMRLSNTNTYSGGTTVNQATLQIAADDRLGTAPGAVTSNHVILNGGTLMTGAQVNTTSLTNPGSGYTSFPTLTINGAGSDSHPAVANVLAGINSIAVTAGGSNYVNQVSAPAANAAGTFVDIVGGGGTGATAFATVSGGVVTGITITNQGTGYTSMPNIHISSTISTGSLAGSGATAGVAGITLQSISLANGGFDYTTPTITLSGGGGAGATATATSTPAWQIATNRGIQLGAGGGTLYQTAGTTLTYAGVINSIGTLTKAGAGTLVLTGNNNYGGTVISGGTLQVGNGILPGLISGDILNNAALVANTPTFVSIGTNVSGNGTLTKIGTGTFALSGTATYTGATTVQSGRLLLQTDLTTSSAITVTLSTLELGEFGGSNRVIKTPTLTFGPNGKVNLQDNKLITKTAVGSWTGSTYNGLTGHIATGKGTGNAWSGVVGIVTSQSNAVGSNFTTLGIARASDVRPATSSVTALWAGQTITGNDTLIMYTYGGDANLDGKLNVDDYVRIDQGIAAGLTGWSNGDFNYDGKVSIDDYTTFIDSNIGNQSLGIFPTAGGVESTSIVAVPEPTALLLLACGLPLRGRKRRNS